MSASLNTIIKVIGPLNNRYRDPSASIREKLEALWELGDQLIRMGVTKPHTIGWAVQRDTRGLIKRPTVFRSHKIRTIWASKKDLIKDLGQLRGLSNLIEILPLIDPSQTVRKQLSHEQLAIIYQHACSDVPQEFKRYINDVKKNFSHGKLGKSLDRSKHLEELHEIISDFRILLAYLIKILEQPGLLERERFRASTPLEELRAFSNMCIALTTKENYRLFKRLEPSLSISQNQLFQKIYNYFRVILEKTSDVERARIRRVISAEELSEMSDMVSSLSTEATVKDFKARKKLTISL
jgi:hypothetical protein